MEKQNYLSGYWKDLSDGKLIRAENMDEFAFLKKFKNKRVSQKETQPGYHITTQGPLHSWLSKDVFENAYQKTIGGEVGLFIDDLYEASAKSLENDFTQ